jgi:hypothetical protein
MVDRQFDDFHTIVRCHSLRRRLLRRLLLLLLLLFLLLLLSLVVDERITKGPCSFPGVAIF